MTRIASALVAVGLALGLSVQAHAAAPPTAACVAAKVLLEDIFSRSPPDKTALDEAAAGEGAGRLVKQLADPRAASIADGAWRSPEPGPVSVKPPSAATIKAFRTARHTSATACEDVRLEAGARGVLLGASYETVASPDRKGRYTRTLHVIGRPVVSPDGTEALAYASEAYGPLAASGGLVLLRKSRDGTWKIVGRLGLWIS